MSNPPGPDPSEADFTPETKAWLLKQYGWNPEAARQTSTVPVNMRPMQDPTAGLYYVDQVRPRIEISSQAVPREAPIGDIYEHEAHHAYDYGPYGAASQFQQPNPDTLANIYSDVNIMHQYAAKNGNRELFDSTNEALWATHNDPAHLNHHLVNIASVQEMPEWYQQRYFSYLDETAKWTGANPNPPSLPIGSSRAEGQQSYARDLEDYQQRVESGEIQPK